jgi:hypothetical protein
MEGAHIYTTHQRFTFKPPTTPSHELALALARVLIPLATTARMISPVLACASRAVAFMSRFDDAAMRVAGVFGAALEGTQDKPPHTSQVPQVERRMVSFRKLADALQAALLENLSDEEFLQHLETLASDERLAVLVINPNLRLPLQPQTTRVVVDDKLAPLEPVALEAVEDGDTLLMESFRPSLSQIRRVLPSRLVYRSATAVGVCCDPSETGCIEREDQVGVYAPV